MKTALKEITVYICSVCGKDEDSYPRCCIECGEHFCWECAKRLATDYQHALHVSGSGDGLYCATCIAKLTLAPDDLFVAYAAIKTLREASRKYYEALEKNGEKLQAQIAKLRKQRGLK